MHPINLVSGSQLAAISPAGPVGRDETERGAKVLRSLGFDVKLLPGALRGEGYLAGDDRDRAADVLRTLTDDSFDGVICTRGGYGSMRLQPHLDLEAVSESIKHKAFIGFSDISALQWALWDRAGRITYSGPQLARGFGGEDKGEGYGGVDRWTGDLFLKTVGGRMWGETLPLPEGGELTVHQGSFNPMGPLLGGNLAVLAALCGTAWQPRFAGGIVLLEEIDEPVYRIDRMLTQLVQSGAFDGARGILLGRFTQHVRGDRVDHAGEAARILSQLLPNLPVVSGAPYGHVGPIWTVPLGAEAVLDLAAGTVRLEAGED